MAEIPPSVDTHVPKGPNFSMVVLISGIVMIVLLLAAYLFLRGETHKLMLQPNTHITSLVLH